MKRCTRVLLLTAASVACISTAAAQEVFGTLRRADTGTPSQGTLVVAERLSSGETVARAVTGAQGTYRLRITTERLVIRALRIGFAPHVIDTVQLALDAQRELHAMLPGTTAALPTVRTAADSRCRIRPDSATLVAKIFHEARTALAASQLVAPDGPVLTRVRVSNETWAANEREMFESSHREYFASELRPFRTASVDSLLEFGFVTRVREPFARHAVDVAVDYRVPSVDLVVDDRFLADYCLYLADAPPDRPDLIGVGFRPAGNRRITQIQGTLWMDKRTAELQRMEFGYAGLDGKEARINPGGWLEFTRLETGLWFVSRWALRVPALGEWIERSGRTTTRVTIRDVPVVRVSGEVLDLAVNGRAVFTVGATDVIEGDALVPRPGPVDSTLAACAASEGQAIAFGTVRSATSAIVRGAVLRFSWREQGKADADVLQSETVAKYTGAYRACNLPHDRLLTVDVRADGYEPAVMTLRIGSPRAAAQLDLVLVPTSGAPAIR